MKTHTSGGQILCFSKQVIVQKFTCEKESEHIFIKIILHKDLFSINDKREPGNLGVKLVWRGLK